MWRMPRYIVENDENLPYVGGQIAGTEAALVQAKEDFSQISEEIKSLEADLAALKRHRYKLEIFAQTGRFPVWTRSEPGCWAEDTWRYFSGQEQQ